MVHFHHADLPVGVVFHLEDVVVGVGEVQVACIGEDEGDNEVAVEVRITHYSFEYKYCVCNFNIPKITFFVFGYINGSS